eukprot:symbB.v1.2.040105.t1/scaffold6994.1/size14017/1
MKAFWAVDRVDALKSFSVLSPGLQDAESLADPSGTDWDKELRRATERLKKKELQEEALSDTPPLFRQSDEWKVERVEIKDGVPAVGTVLLADPRSFLESKAMPAAMRTGWRPSSESSRRDKARLPVVLIIRHTFDSIQGVLLGSWSGKLLGDMDAQSFMTRPLYIGGANTSGLSMVHSYPEMPGATEITKDGLATRREASVRRHVQRNPYDILGLSRSSNYEDIRAAFRKLARTYHPDVPGTGDEDRFRSIKEALEELETLAGRARWSGAAGAQRSAAYSASSGSSYASYTSDFRGYGYSEYSDYSDYSAYSEYTRGDPFQREKREDRKRRQRAEREERAQRDREWRRQNKKKEEAKKKARAPDQDMIMERELKKAQVRLGSPINNGRMTKSMEEATLQVGDTVEFVGLVKSSEDNGKKGTITKWIEDKKRFEVEVSWTTPKKCKAENLKKLPPKVVTEPVPPKQDTDDEEKKASEVGDGQKRKRSGSKSPEKSKRSRTSD